MIKTVIDAVISAIKDAGADRVYSAFDAVPIEYKGRDIFTTVGVSSLECSAPIFTGFKVYIPFSAETEINITAPKELSAGALYDYYTEYISAAVGEISGLSSSLKKLLIKYDSNISRLVLTVRVAVSGISSTERS